MVEVMDKEGLDLNREKGVNALENALEYRLTHLQRLFFPSKT